MMSETRPTYTTPLRRRHDDPAANAATIMADTRRELTAHGIADADALLAALSAFVAAISEQREHLAAGTLHYVPLTIVTFRLRDLRRQVEALGVGL